MDRFLSQGGVPVRQMRIAIQLLIVVFCGRPLAAQVVDGKLVETAGAPVARALVSLVDSAGRAVATSQTRADGGFRLTAPGPGTYRVRAERVGRAATVSEPLALAAGELRPLRLEARGEAVMLEGIVAAAGERGCSVRPDRDARVATVWEEARKALSAAEWTRVNERSDFSVRQYTRDMDAATLTVRKEEASTHRARQVTPFRALPVRQLAERGYVQREGRELVYYAPDAEVLLSDAFLDAHCFSLERDDRKPGMVGLAFQPARGRRLPDVAGVFWLDQATAELRELDYEYTGVEVGEAAMDHRGRPISAPRHEWGGRLEFERNPEGAWFVRRWRIRMPITGSRAPDAGRLGAQAQANLGLVAVRETGAEVVGLRTAAGQVVIADQPAGGAAVRGVVHDSTRARGLAGATVFLVGTDYVTETDSAGAFVLRGVPDGRYSIAFSHPRADSLVYVPEPVEVELARGREDSVRLSLGRPRRLAAASAGSDSAIALAPLAVMAEATQRRLTRYGFYDRQRVGSGVFMTTEDFVKRRGARLMDRIQGLRGTYLRPVTSSRAASFGNSSTDWVFVQYKNGSQCQIPIWINGAQSTVRQLERIPPDDVEAIEVYSGDEVPLRFAQVNRLAGRPPCGAVVVWLRTQI